MSALIRRELIGMVRQPALIVAASAQIVFLAAFVALWQDALPGGRTSLYEAARQVQWWTLTVSLPWVAVRVLAAEDPNDLVLLSALTARRPAALIAARAVAIAAVLLIFSAAGTPLLVLAQQMSGVTILRLAQDTPALLTLIAVASTAAVGWHLIVRDRLGVWACVAASEALVLAGGSLLPASLSTALGVAAAALVLAVAASWSDSSFLYLAEHHA